MNDPKYKPKFGWDDIDPEVIAFGRDKNPSAFLNNLDARQPVSFGRFSRDSWQRMSRLLHNLLACCSTWPVRRSYSTKPPPSNAVINDPKNKPKFGWDDIDPEVIAFGRDQNPAGATVDKLTQNQPLPNAVPPDDEDSPPNPANKTGPERLIGPRNPAHPQVNQQSGGRDPT